MALWLPVAGLLFGVLVGLAFRISIPPDYARYTAIAILAGLDAVVGAARSALERRYNNEIFLSGLAANMVLAAGLTLLGDRLGVDLYLAAVVAFGVRLFNNVAVIRRTLLGIRRR